VFDHCLYFNTTALARRLEREWAAAFKPFDLSPPQGFLLRAILANPGVPQRELAATLAIARPTATRALDQLSEKGFVKRRTSAGDGREVFIFPTDKASEIQVRLNEASGRVTHRLKRFLGTEVFEETVAKVRGVRSALK
jgi:DNA-binding MarR family transcriptional regulator